MSCSSWPFGPFTVTCPPAIVTSTPLGTVIGCLPMRDIGDSATRPGRGPRRRPCARALRGRSGVPGSWTRSRCPCRPARGAPHRPSSRPAGPGRDTRFKPGDRAARGRCVYFILIVSAATGTVGSVARPRSRRCSPRCSRMRGDRFLELRRRHHDVVVERDVGVPEAGEHVGDRVGHRHRAATPLTTTTSSRRGPHRHAPSFRRQIRHSPKSRYTERARPQRRQRVYRAP